MKPEVQKLLWRSRRGMLELDKLFRNYLEQHGDVLDDHQLEQITHLLEYQDQDLFDAFSGKRPLQDETLDRLFTQIKDRVKA
jgi:antitoxin CptB